MKICDVCYSLGRTVESTHTIWHKSAGQRGYQEKVQLDTCRAHKDFFKNGTFEQNRRNARLVLGLPVE